MVTLEGAAQGINRFSEGIFIWEEEGDLQEDSTACQV